MVNVKWISVIGAVLLLLACSRGRHDVNADIDREEISVSLEGADRFWEGRLDSSMAMHALWSYEDLAKTDTTSIELWAKLSRAYYFRAQFLETDPIKKDSLFMLGYRTSQATLKRNPDYVSLRFSTGDEKVSIQGLGPEYVDILYWGAANYGRWLETKGPLVRLGQRDLVNTILDHIHDLDSSYYYGAYFRFKGALLARDPDSERDTLAIRQAFETALDMAPEYLGNYTFMAMYYCPLIRNKDLFYRLLTRVITTPSDKLLSCYPENELEKAQAERLMIQAEKENWF